MARTDLSPLMSHFIKAEIALGNRFVKKKKKSSAYSLCGIRYAGKETLQAIQSEIYTQRQ